MSLRVFMHWIFPTEMKERYCVMPSYFPQIDKPTHHELYTVEGIANGFKDFMQNVVTTCFMYLHFHIISDKGNMQMCTVDFN